MATTFTGSLKVTATGTLSKTTDFTTTTDPLSYSKTFDLANGTSADQANMMWSDQRTLTASSTENIDLAGSLTNAFGDAITFTKLRGIIIYAASGNTNNVLLGGDAASISTLVGNINDIIVIRPGGMFAAIAPDATGYAVTATTADIIKIANSAGSTSVTYDIVLIGCV